MKIINCHMHLLNFDYIPDSYFKIQTKLPEWFIRLRFIQWIGKLIIHIFQLKSLNHGYEITSLMNLDIEDIVKNYIREMDESNCLIATPLMLDIEIGANMKPEISFEEQIQRISEVCLKSGGRLMPFISVDPRKKNANEIIKDALENKGFLGVKLYPPLGYNIDPYNIYNIEHGYTDTLLSIYSYCSEHDIPITTHCSKGGAYSNELVHEKDFGDYLSHPKHIAQILKLFPLLRINIAHLGGDLHEFGQKDNWSNIVLRLTNKYNNVYSDICCQTQSFKEKEQGVFIETIQKALNHSKLSQKIIYGTDWPISGIEYSEKEYAQEMIKVLKEHYEKVVFDNPKAFLFNNKGIPDRIKTFYHMNNVSFHEEVLAYCENK